MSSLLISRRGAKVYNPPHLMWHNFHWGLLLVLTNLFGQPSWYKQQQILPANAIGENAKLLSVDTANLHWAQQSHEIKEVGSIRTVSKSGGAMKIRAPVADRVSFLTACGHGVCWAELDYRLNGGVTKLMYVPVAGGAPIRLATGSFYVNRIAAEGSWLYWLDPGGANVDRGGTLTRVNVGGGAPEVVARDLELVMDATLDSNYYYVVEGARETARVIAVPRKGGARVKLADLSPRPYRVNDLTSDSSSLYWLSTEPVHRPQHEKATIQRLSKDGGTPVTVAGAGEKPWYIVRLGTRMAFTALNGELEVLRSGKAPVAFLSGSPAIDSAVADTTRVYWLSEGHGLWSAPLR